MTNKFEIGGDGEQADILVCVRLTSPLMLSDNEIGLCSECGEAIQHRPHVPKSPRKMCLECAGQLVGADAATGELSVMITPETFAELESYFRKKNAN